jgi:hypothetical protein
MEEIQYTTRNSFCKGAGVKLKNFRKESAPAVLMTLKNSFIYDTISQIMHKLVPAGIPQYLIKYHEFNMFKVFVPVTLSSLRVLGLQDLEYGFVLWLGACGISTFGFLLENLWFKFRSFLRNCLGLWILLTFLNNNY